MKNAVCALAGTCLLVMGLGFSLQAQSAAILFYMDPATGNKVDIPRYRSGVPGRDRNSINMRLSGNNRGLSIALQTPEEKHRELTRANLPLHRKPEVKRLLRLDVVPVDEHWEPENKHGAALDRQQFSLDRVGSLVPIHTSGRPPGTVTKPVVPRTVPLTVPGTPTLAGQYYLFEGAVRLDDCDEEKPMLPVAPVPLPAAFWLFAPVMLLLARLRQAKGRTSAKRGL